MLVNTVSSVVLGAKYVNGSKYDVILQSCSCQEKVEVGKVLNEFLPMAPRIIDFINPTPLCPPRIKRSILLFQHLFFFHVQKTFRIAKDTGWPH
jgi:hypothetical protein